MPEPAYGHLMSRDSLTLTLDGRVLITIKKSDPAYEKIASAVRSENYVRAVALARDKKASQAVVAAHAELLKDTSITINNGQPYWRDRIQVGAIAARILQILDETGDLKPFDRFLTNCAANPRPDAVAELFEFMTESRMPITEDGCFLGYKVVTPSFKDKWTKTIDNSVGSRPCMDRDKCDPSRHNVCSTGFHVCALSYVENYSFSGDPLVTCKVNPRDVTAVPVDYNGAKLRCCAYEVIGIHLGGQNTEAFSKAVIEARPAPEPARKENGARRLVAEAWDEFKRLFAAGASRKDLRKHFSLQKRNVERHLERAKRELKAAGVQLGSLLKRRRTKTPTATKKTSRLKPRTAGATQTRRSPKTSKPSRARRQPARRPAAKNRRAKR